MSLSITPRGVRRIFNQKLRPMVSFTFDDGNASDYDVVFPAFKSAGIRGTFFVYGQGINGSGRLTEDNLKEMADAGQEIGCHSYTHTDWFTNMTDEQIIIELTTNKAYLENIINRPVLTHGIIYGQTDARVANLLGGFYEAARRSQERVMVYGENNLYGVPGSFCDTKTVQEMKDLVDLSYQGNEPCWMCLAFHGTGPGDAEFLELVDYVKGLKQDKIIDVVPFYEGARRIQMAHSITL